LCLDLLPPRFDDWKFWMVCKVRSHARTIPVELFILYFSFDCGPID
jgi:hypothetical protein